MFNPEKLLGGLLSGSLGGRGTKAKVGVGMGLLGVAMEAFEHFTSKSDPPGAPGAGTAPPPPPSSAKRRLPPGAPPASSPPSPPPPAPGSRQETAATPPSTDQDAILLIRAMIGAANADGVIDADERERILDSLNRSNLSPEEQTFIENELLSPADQESIVRQVTSPGMARRVYTVSLMAITVDTEAEKVYMDNLARRLELDQSVLNDIYKKSGRETQ